MKRPQPWAHIAAAGLALSAAVLHPSRSHAQSTAEALLESAPGNDHLRGRVSMDPAFMFGLGYVRTLDLDRAGARQLGLHADLEALVDFSSWDLTLGASTRLFDRPGFDVLGVVDLDLALAQNEVHTALAYGLRFSLLPGYFGRHWLVAAEASLRSTLAVSLWHKDAYVDPVPDANDATYWTGAAYLYLGASTGVRLFERYFVGTRFAYRIPTTFERYGPWVQPITLSLEFGGSFGSQRPPSQRPPAHCHGLSLRTKT